MAFKLSYILSKVIYHAMAKLLTLFHHEASWVFVKWPGRKKNAVLQIHILQLYVSFNFAISLTIPLLPSCYTTYRCRVPFAKITGTKQPEYISEFPSISLNRKITINNM